MSTIKGKTIRNYLPNFSRNIEKHWRKEQTMIKKAKVPGQLLFSSLSTRQFSKMLTLAPHAFPLEITATIKNWS